MSCWEKPSFWFCSSSARYLLSTSLREISAASVGCCWKNPSWEKPLCCEENPWLFWEKPLCGGLFLGKPIVILGKTCFFFGACWCSWPLLRLVLLSTRFAVSLVGCCSRPVLGGFCVFGRSLSGKTLLGKKTFS